MEENGQRIMFGPHAEIPIKTEVTAIVCIDATIMAFVTLATLSLME